MRRKSGLFSWLRGLVTIPIAGCHVIGAVYTFPPVYTPGPDADDYQDTDWENTVAVNKFDPSWGTLTAVVLHFQGFILIDYGVENLDSNVNSAAFTWTFSSQFTLSLPDGGSTLVTMSPGFTGGVSRGPFDDEEDFGGTSGIEYLDQLVSDSSSATFTDQSYLDMFTGSGTVSLSAEVWANMDFTSSTSDYMTYVTTRARAVITVEYQYTPVPEPAAVGAITGLALLGYAGWRRRA